MLGVQGRLLFTLVIAATCFRGCHLEHKQYDKELGEYLGVFKDGSLQVRFTDVGKLLEMLSFEDCRNNIRTANCHLVSYDLRNF